MFDTKRHAVRHGIVYAGLPFAIYTAVMMRVHEAGASIESFMSGEFVLMLAAALLVGGVGVGTAMGLFGWWLAKTLQGQR